jgi:hypothetical protein
MKHMISIGETLDLICRRTGKSRTQAKRELLEKLQSGELRATGVLVRKIDSQRVTSGRREIIDPEFWQDEPMARKLGGNNHEHDQS